MEEDDEFGDLYTDVLTSFANSSSLPVQNSVSINNDRKESTNLSVVDSDSHRELNRITLEEPKLPSRVLEIDRKVNLGDDRKLGFEDPNMIDESQINVIEDDINGDDGIGDSVIPGGLESGVNGNGGGFKDGYDAWDSDSDSDDGLQIVLNDYNAGQIRDGEDVDEDGNVLVVADEDANRQQMEEQDWGGDVELAQGGDGESEDLGDDLMKVNDLVQPSKFGYNNQFHSQFKYTRPGAASLASGGPSGQVRPPLIVGPTPGRGRGDWRPSGLKNVPPMQKGYGMPVWANNNPGHGSGRGSDFTLPSHKTVFEVDIDSFEEKPWRLPGVDMSDFFNFGLNEDSWKNYCKQLEQVRLEATMQSKIRVYESGRTEQNYDPDMPPELAAAAGIHDSSADNTNLEKEEVGHTDIAKGSMGARPQLQTGRAIQVETGYGERLPSIDTRPPRIRDSDAIIEIVLQDSANDDFVNGKNITELPQDTSKEGLRGGHDIEEDNAREDTEILDSAPEAYNDRKRELAGRKIPLNKPVHGRMIDGISRVMLEAPVQNPSGSAEKNPVYTGPHQDESGRKGNIDRSPSITHSRSTSDKRFIHNQRDESAENTEVKRSSHFPSRHPKGVTEEQYFEEEDSIHDEQPDGSFELDRVDVDLNVEDTHKDEYSAQFLKKQKINLRNEQSLEDVDDGEGSKAARSSENSKAISGSTCDYRNLPYGTEDEVVQDGRSTQMRIKRKVEGDHYAGSKGLEETQDMDRHHMVIKGRDDPYYRKNWDSNPTYHSHLKADTIDRRKESGNSGGSWRRKDEESHGRRTRYEDPKKRDYSNEMGPRHRSKGREIERNDLDQYQLRKQLDNGSRRGGYHDKYLGLRHWDRDDNIKFRSDNLDDLHGKRRKEDVHIKRDRGEKEDFLHVRRENSSLQKRERDDIMEQRKRDDIARIRNVDQQSVRHKEEMWFSRDRVDKQRNDWQRLKQSHEETLSKREREDVRIAKNGRTGEEKSRASHSRAKDEHKGSDREYHLKDPGSHSEQYKRKDRVENESLSHCRGSEEVYSRETRPNNDERRSRLERPSARSDRALNASEHQRVPEKNHKEYPRKIKESEEDQKSVVRSKRNQDDHNSQISERVKIKGIIEQESGDQVIPESHQSSRKHKKDAFSDDEQHDLMRGRSKLERWTSHKERDFNAGTKSSSLNVKEIDDQSKVETLVANTVPDESSKMAETGQNLHSLANERGGDDQVNKDGEVRPKEDEHLDTVAKLKKRSERFKLPMPSEKELGAVKKVENEQLPPVQTESRTDSEIKQERPARKRRWTGN